MLERWPKPWLEWILVERGRLERARDRMGFAEWPVPGVLDRLGCIQHKLGAT